VALASSKLALRISQIKSMALSKTARYSLILFGGNLANALLSMVAVIIVSRILGPVNFGVLAVFNAIFGLMLGLTDFGLGTTAIKLISSQMENNKHRAAVTMRVILKLELVAGFVVGIIGLLCAGPIASAIGGPHLLNAVRLAFLASAFASAGAFVVPFLVAKQQFLKNAIIGISVGFIRTLGVVLLLTWSALNLSHVLWVYTVAPIVAFFIGLYFAPRDWRVKPAVGEEKEAFGQIFHFSKWVLLSYFATMAASRLDIFLLSSMKGSEAVGLYAAALQLASVMPLLIGAVTTVLLPRVSQLGSRDEFKSYLKKVLLGATVVVIVLAPVAIFGDLVIKLIFGAKYVAAIPAFKVLFAAYLVAIFANPIGIIFYGINKPNVLTFYNYLQLALTLVLNLALIPGYGPLGSAVAFLLANTLSAGLTSLHAFITIKRMKASHGS
jgi:O-antigen/teichoic acid export membrane protein